jgi:hypothetical protein
MSVEIHEAFVSREAELSKQGPSVTLRYIAVGSYSQVEVEAAAIYNTPAEVVTGDGRNFVRQKMSTRQRAGAIYDVTVTYGSRDDPKSEDPPETGDLDVEFDTTGGTQHITQSRATRMRTARIEEDGPDFKGAIGVTGDGKHRRVTGVDVVIPELKIIRRVFQPASLVNAAYIKTVARLTGSMNSNAMFDFAPGELLFLGARGRYRAARDDWEITYTWAASENIEAGDLPDIGENSQVNPIVKKGHDFLWIWYRPFEDTTAKAIIPNPTCGYVEQIYPEKDHSALGVT